jgi:hypothetical protein
MAYERISNVIFVVWGWYNRPVVAAVPSGLSFTPLRMVGDVAL